MVPTHESNHSSDREPPDDERTARIVAAVRDAPRPVVNTSYLAGHLAVPVGDLRSELDALVERGVLDHHEVEHRGHLWWLTLDTELDG